MKIEDLTPDYVRYLESGDLDVYERSKPKLFQHYFEYWGDRNNFSVSLDKGDVEKRKKLILDELSDIELKFSKLNIDLSNLNIILLVGQNSTNGHAISIDEEYAVFLPIEGYESKSQVQVFVPHEIIHALHYIGNPDFYFSNETDKEKMSRLLITEGLATYVAKKIMGQSAEDALWADYRSVDEIEIWLNRFESNRKFLSKFALEQFNNSDSSFMFYTSGQSVVGRDREGYLLGLEIIENLVEENQYSLDQLLSLERSVLERKSLDVLRGMFT